VGGIFPVESGTYLAKWKRMSATPSAKANPFQKLSIWCTVLAFVRSDEPSCHMPKPVRIGLASRLIHEIEMDEKEGVEL